MLFKPLSSVTFTGKRALLYLVLTPFVLISPGYGMDTETTKGPGADVLQKYIVASKAHEDSLRGGSMEVEIDASVPKLQEEGRLHALRKISQLGQITYHVLGFQGDNTVKNQVIARYLQAEQQGQGDQSLEITPENYKFKYKGQRPDREGNEVYAFTISPRKAKVGLFKGEIWIDEKTYLIVYEEGRLVKNPSVFFKKVEFQRTFRVQDGRALPQNIMSTIDTRIIGKVQLNINFSNFSPQGASEPTDGVAQAATPPEYGKVNPGNAGNNAVPATELSSLRLQFAVEG